MSYVDKVRTRQVETERCSVSAECTVCGKSKERSWIILKNAGLKDTNEKFLHYCSYLCYTGCKAELPKNVGRLVENKEDFNDLRPVLKPRKKEFHMLTFHEIKELSETQKETYYKEMDNHFILNPSLYQLYEDEYQEDARIYDMECCDDSLSDDDYTTEDYR